MELLLIACQKRTRVDGSIGRRSRRKREIRGLEVGPSDCDVVDVSFWLDLLGNTHARPLLEQWRI